MKRLSHLGRHLSSARTAAGFNLVELMISVAIVGILAAIAYPSYQNYVTRTHRNAAKACLSEYAQFMERYHTTHLTYEGAEDQPIPSCSNEGKLPERYTFSVDDPTGMTYLVVATPRGIQERNDTACAILSIDQTGQRHTSVEDATACW